MNWSPLSAISGIFINVLETLLAKSGISPAGSWALNAWVAGPGLGRRGLPAEDRDGLWEHLQMWPVPTDIVNPQLWGYLPFGMHVVAFLGTGCRESHSPPFTEGTVGYINFVHSSCFCISESLQWNLLWIISHVIPPLPSFKLTVSQLAFERNGFKWFSQCFALLNIIAICSNVVWHFACAN